MYTGKCVENFKKVVLAHLAAYQHRKKKHKRVKSIIDYGLRLIQMVLCTLHSADVRVQLIKEADT